MFVSGEIMGGAQMKRSFGLLLSLIFLGYSNPVFAVYVEDEENPAASSGGANGGGDIGGGSIGGDIGGDRFGEISYSNTHETNPETGNYVVNVVATIEPADPNEGASGGRTNIEVNIPTGGSSRFDGTGELAAGAAALATGAERDMIDKLTKLRELPTKQRLEALRRIINNMSAGPLKDLAKKEMFQIFESLTFSSSRGLSAMNSFLESGFISSALLRTMGAVGFAAEAGYQFGTWLYKQPAINEALQTYRPFDPLFQFINPNPARSPSTTGRRGTAR